MARNDCGQCCALKLGARIEKDVFYSLAARLLCGISDILESVLTGINTIAGGVSAPTQVGTPALVRIAAASVPAAFPGTPQFNDTNNKIYLNIYNGTNKTVLIGFDGLTAAETLPPSTALVYKYGEMEPPKFEARPVYVMDDGVAPTAGEVTISAQY